MSIIGSTQEVQTDDGYMTKLQQITHGDLTWYEGYVYVPISYQYLIDLSDYANVSHLIRSPIDLNYGGNECVGFSTRNSYDKLFCRFHKMTEYDYATHRLTQLKSALDKYYRKHIPQIDIKVNYQDDQVIEITLDD
jgi:hypothetical protein